MRALFSQCEQGLAEANREQHPQRLANATIAEQGVVVYA